MEELYKAIDTLSQDEKNEMLKKIVASLLLFPFNDNLEKIYEWHYNTIKDCNLLNYSSLVRMVKDAQTASRFKKHILTIWSDICDGKEIVLKCGDKEYDANWLASLAFLLSEEDITNV